VVDLIRSRVRIPGTNIQEYSFLQLLYNLKVIKIDLSIAVTKSGLHYGHYLAQTRSNIISTFKYKLVNYALANRTPLEQWKQGVLVILEKERDNINITKLRAILLLEVDFNGLDKIIFNSRVLPILEK